MSAPHLRFGVPTSDIPKIHSMEALVGVGSTIKADRDFGPYLLRAPLANI